MQHLKEHRYDRVIESSEPKSGMPIYEFLNLKLIKNDNNPLIKMDGTFFVVSMATNYSHTLLDVIGAYYQFKDLYPDLIPIFIKENMKLKLREYKNLPLEEFAIDNNFIIIDLNKNNFLFEKAIIHNYFFSPVKIKNLISDDDIKQKIFYSNSIKKVLENIKKPEVKNFKKIYVSRGFANKNRKLSNNKHMAEFFTYDEKYDIKLENFFKSQGFDIIELEDLNLSEQIKIFSECIFLAGIEGTNLLNAIWMKDNTPVFKIKIFENYFSWENIFSSVNQNNIHECNIIGLNTDEGLNKIFNDFNKLFLSCNFHSIL